MPVVDPLLVLAPLLLDEPPPNGDPLPGPELPLAVFDTEPVVGNPDDDTALGPPLDWPDDRPEDDPVPLSDPGKLALDTEPIEPNATVPECWWTGHTR